jgi:enhancing lycopene biosynthesis protein 2
MVVIVARGHVTAEEIAENTRVLVEANVPSFAKIIDVTGSASSLAREQVERIAALLRGGSEGPTRGPVAFVVNPQRSGFAEAFAEVTQGERPIELFTSLHAARRWLREAAAGAPSGPVSFHLGVRIRG